MEGGYYQFDRATQELIGFLLILVGSMTMGFLGGCVAIALWLDRRESPKGKGGTDALADQ